MGGGGKGGAGDGGASQARAEEEARKARIAGNIDAIKRKFYAPEFRDVPEPILVDGIVTNQQAIDEANAFNAGDSVPLSENPTQARQDAFADIERRVRNRFTPDFEDDIKDARRELKFALSRRNLLGSSGQADAEDRLNDRIAEGQRQISQRVASARSQKEAFDQNLMNNLISQAQSDVARSSLLGGLGANLQSNTNRAISAINEQGLGNIFGDVGTLFKEINDQRAVQAGLANAGLFAGLNNAGNNQSPTSLFGRNTRSSADNGIVNNL